MNRRKKSPKKSSPPAAHHQLRIIGGEWRSRKLAFTPIEGLRPTQDRVRETLFNWLMYDIEGESVLDVFAGSGALGIEALSRGAKHVQFLEKSSVAATQLRQHMATLHCSRGSIHHVDALQFLHTKATAPFHVIFLDPPFHQGLLQPCCEQLVNNGYSEVDTFIYIEAENTIDLSTLPPQWRQIKNKSHGEKYVLLYQHQS